VTDQKKPESKKPEPRKFSRQMIVDFVDLMMLADQIVAEYKRRHEDTGEEAFVEELGFHDRVHLASTLMGLQVHDAIAGDADVRRAAFERMKDLQTIQEAEQKAATPPPQVVRLEPDKIERAFSQVAEDHGVPNARARQFVKLLMTTPEGHQMLQLMLHDVVQIQRGQPKGG
jgi:hypothetical protein